MLDPGPARGRRLQSPASLCDHDSKIAFAAARIIAVLERAPLIQLSNAEVVKIFRRVLLGHADTYHSVRENVEEQVHPNDLPRAYATHNISVVKHMGQQVRTKVPQDNLRLFRRCVIHVSL